MATPYERKLENITKLLNLFNGKIITLTQYNEDLRSLEAEVNNQRVIFDNNNFNSISFGLSLSKISKMVHEFCSRFGYVASTSNFVELKHSDNDSVAYKYFQKACTDEIKQYKTQISFDKLIELNVVDSDLKSIQFEYSYPKGTKTVKFTIAKIKCNADVNILYDNSYVLLYKPTEKDIEDLANKFRLLQVKDDFINKAKNISFDEIHSLFEELLLDEGFLIQHKLADYIDDAVRSLNREYVRTS